MIQKQREELNLKVGDEAYMVDEWSLTPESVIITGECDEGYGYLATNSEGQDIHTCNGTLIKTKRETRAELVKIATKLRKAWVEKQAEAGHAIRYIDWILSRGGRW